MLAQLMTASIIGIDVLPVDIEVDIAKGLPAITIVGLPDTSVQEARERIRAALTNSGFSFPKTRVTINLAPADVKKEGSGFDLPIALGMLVASGVITKEQIQDILAVGELALDGSIRQVHGGLLYGMCAEAQKKRLLIPTHTSFQAGVIKGAKVIPLTSLQDAVLYIKGAKKIEASTPRDTKPLSIQENGIEHIIGQHQAKRALSIAAAGRHNILFTGPPGTGKTMLARSLATLLPPLTHKEQIEVTKNWAAAGALPVDGGLIVSRPFRNPHHSASSVALIGGGSKAAPGEISLAHKGVLFLDECTEFPAHVLNTLRQPIESGCITISRAERSHEYPASFQLVAAMNPCPCGNAGSEELLCSCSSQERLRYQKRISGPLLDRIDMVVRVPRQAIKALHAQESVTSQEIKTKVIAAQQKQFSRQNGKQNALLSKRELKMYCTLSSCAEELLFDVVNKLHLSRRAVDSMVRVARTIADLDGSPAIEKQHIAESTQFRVVKEDLFSS